MTEEFKGNPCPLCLLIKAGIIAYDKVKKQNCEEGEIKASKLKYNIDA